MRVIQATLLVVLTLAGVVIFGPLVLIVLFGSLPQIGFIVLLVLGGSALLTALVIIPQVAANNRQNAELKVRKATAEAQMATSFKEAGFANQQDFRAAGGGWSDPLREALARSQGHETWQSYCAYFASERQKGVTIDTLTDGRPTHRELATAVNEQKATALLQKIAESPRAAQP